ncbi:inosine/xanthosine triphosphatase [Candidatus Dojkabacteria bacterium]|uniref:Probable inosine/xanthosine triphosphatase n=1 Tax=Candidatus Dojkabacteria bacterium TaxID=2099670 RepID=A0A955RLI2_9BACT|nr:inosine/xanthosine triphosphatase [Candidatus Dojkabacteria bacterium]
MKKVIIASKNPVKIETTKLGFGQMFKDQKFEFEGISVPSNVSDQPMSNKETVEGATNRALNAKKEQEGADYWVGIEGGLEDEKGKLVSFAWIVIINKHGYVSKSRTSDFTLPDRVSELIHQGYELGDADDIVFKKENSKQANGSVGILTHDVITRTQLYEHAIIMALIPYVNEELYLR